MLPDRVSNPGPLTYESGALPIALRGPAKEFGYNDRKYITLMDNCYHDYKMQITLEHLKCLMTFLLCL